MRHIQPISILRFFVLYLIFQSFVVLGDINIEGKDLEQPQNRENKECYDNPDQKGFPLGIIEQNYYQISNV